MTSPDTEFIRIVGTEPGTGESPTARAPAKAPPAALPILGLSDIVIFPGMVAPLLVDTAPSIRLIDDVVEGDRLLVLVLQRRAEVDNPAPEDLYEYGCAARVLKMLKFPDNTVRVLVEGLWRVRLKEYETQTPYLRAQIEVRKDAVIDSVELTALSRNAHQKFQEIVKLTPALSEQVKVAALNTESPGNLTDLIASNLNLSLEERQRLLEINDVQERLNRLRPLLDRELEVTALSSKIQNDVASTWPRASAISFCASKSASSRRNSARTIPPLPKSTRSASRLRRRACPKKPTRPPSRNWNASSRCPPPSPSTR